MAGPAPVRFIGGGRLSAYVASPPATFALLAALAVAGIPLVWLLGRHPTPTYAAIGALSIQAALCLLLAVLHHDPMAPWRRVVQAIAVVALGLLMGFPAYFFGPNSGFAAAVALLLIVSGVLAGGAPIRFPALAGWLTYGAIALGQAAAFGLVMAHWLPDHSLTIVIVGHHPTWHIVTGHGYVQGMYLAAFLAGRAFQRRYLAVARQVDDATHSAARREALLEEARAEYKRALMTGRLAVFSGAPVSSISAERNAAETVDLGPRPDTVRDPIETEVGAPAPAPSSTPPGEILADRLRRAERLPEQEIRRLAGDLGAELEKMHEQGSVYFDVDPSHIVRTTAGYRLGPSVLQGADAMSAMRYLAPERIAGKVADARADQYGLAAVLYASVSGCDPFGEVDAGVLSRAVVDRFPIAPRILAEIPEDVEHVLRIGLAKAPADRFESVRELREAFLVALEGRLSEPTRQKARGMARRATFAGGPAAKVIITPEFPSSAEDSASSSGQLPEEAWRQAYRSKVRGFYVGLTVFCLTGSAFLGLVALRRGPLYFAWASMAGIVAAAWLHRWLGNRRYEETYWLWVIVGVLSVGPAFSIGLHCAFGALIAVWLFASGLFRATQRRSWGDTRAVLLAGVLLAHTTVFVLVMTGVLGDLGNIPIRQAGAPSWATVLTHVLLMSTYVAGVAGGLAIDRRYESLTWRAQEAAREAARQETLLATARRELEFVLADESSGIFSGLRIGRYELGRVLGRGGMGEVYLATCVDSRTRVAVKMVRADRVANAHHLQMFLKEADALRRVQSAYVARILEVAGIEREMPYIVMEYIEGRSLAEILRERTSMSLPEVRALIQHVGSGLHEVHNAGVVHRDLKPHNIIHTATEGVPWKLVDFGVATTLDEKRVDAIVGTPPYMAPEQARGELVDARADLYSLCLVVYRALTGRPAFVGQSPREVARAMLAGGPPDPRAYLELPEDVVLALRIGLAPHPEDRFADAQELARAFEVAFDGRLSLEYCRRARRLLRQTPWS